MYTKGVCMKNTNINLDPPLSSQNFITVKEAAKILMMSKWSVYQLIKTDPHFPYSNVGIKKKLLIDKTKLESWSLKRTFEEKAKNNFIPSANDLLLGAFL